MKKCSILLIICISIILFCSGCYFFTQFAVESAESTTPLPAEAETPEMTPESTPESTPDPTGIPTSVPGPTPIREELTPLLETAAENIEINACSDPSTPFAEDSDSCYSIYIINISRESAHAVCSGDEDVIQFELHFNNVSGVLLFDCPESIFSCGCNIIGDLDGIFTAEAVIVEGTLTCLTNQEGGLVSYSITDMFVRAEALTIETDNSFINELLAQYIESFSATYLPCIQGLVFTAFSDLLDEYIQ